MPLAVDHGVVLVIEAMPTPHPAGPGGFAE